MSTDEVQPESAAGQADQPVGETVSPAPPPERIDVQAALAGNEYGAGKGITTYPESQDQAQIDAHAECVQLEQEGKVYRYIDRSGSDWQIGVKHIIWLPVEPMAATPFFDTDEPEKKSA